MSHQVPPPRPLDKVSVESGFAVLVIFAAAFSARLGLTLRGSGLFGLHFYDDGVHYAAATGLVHGLLPYRDFLLLHPPGIVLGLVPFAELGRWLGEDRGFAVARLSFVVLGAVNAVLVSRYLRGVGIFAAWFGGLCYALFWPAVYTEHTVLLEGPANTCLLVALLLLTPRDIRTALTTRKLLVAGAILGLATTIKIWGVVPILVLFGWLVFRYRWRPAGFFLLGAAVATTVVCLPFFLAAPGTMWRMVVVDQLQRNETAVPLIERLNDIAGLTLYHLPNQITLLTWVIWVGLVLAMLAAWTRPRSRPALLLLIGLVSLLLVTPSWYLHYSALTAGVLALVVGTAGQVVLDLTWLRHRGRPRSAVGTVLVLALGAFSLPIGSASTGQQFPGQSLGAVAAGRPGCVTSDHPSALILMNVLGRNLERGCPLVVDLGGASYHLPSPDRGLVSRRRNAVFQRYALAYLGTGDTMLLARFRPGFGLSAASFRRVETWPALARVGPYTLRKPRP